VLEVAAGEAEAVAARYSKAGVPARVIGKVCMCPAIVTSIHNAIKHMHGT
jgi:hypothetical protein